MYEFPEVKDYAQKIEVTYPKYKSLYKKYRENPIAHLVGKIPDYYDTEGNLVRGTIKLKEIEKMEKEEINRLNNLLELDLLGK